MGYKAALEAAGCKVIEFKTFGSYQGEWLALVEYKGERGIIEGYYGSCSHCDAFEAAFGHDDPPYIRDGKYIIDWEEVTKEEYEAAHKAYQTKLREFGERYLLAGLYDRAHYEHRLKGLKSDDWFDSETKEYIQWALAQKF
jgi:hypothetical protein